MVRLASLPLIVALHESFPRSPPITIGDIGSVHFRLRNPKVDQSVDLLRADLKIEGSTIFVNFSRADQDWPFAIENDSDYEVALCQMVPCFDALL
jgi:vacuolar protein sorting-associated protein 13A/C